MFNCGYVVTCVDLYGGCCPHRFAGVYATHALCAYCKGRLMNSYIAFPVLQESAESDETGAGASSAATTLSGMIDEDRIAEIQRKRRRVHEMIDRQWAATSQWWRDAVQRYEQRRMWMHLGPPKQGQLPERFVRIHEVMIFEFCPNIL